MRIAIFVFNDVEELDAIGPWEVFQTAADMNPDIHCEILSLDGKTIRASKGLSIGVDGAMDHSQEYDLVLLPGGQGTRALIKDKTFLQTLTRYIEQATWVTSVCSGALVYAVLGLLKDRPCTTHHGVVDLLKTLEPSARIQTHQRFVADGHLVTAAGVSAGIDMALWLLGTLYEPSLAKQVQHHIEYYPQPPFAD